MDAAGRRGSEEPACDVRRRAQQALFDETDKNFAEPEWALLNIIGGLFKCSIVNFDSP